MYRAGFFDHTQTGYWTATTPASGPTQGFLGPVPPGYCWYIERWSLQLSAARAGATVELFVQRANQLEAGFTATIGQRSGRQDFATCATILGASGPTNVNPIYVPEDYNLVAAIVGLTAADVAQFSAQFSAHLLSLHIESQQEEVQQTEPTPNINAEEVARDDSLLEEAMHATADLFRDVGKVL